MQKSLVRKGLVLGIIVLFVGTSVIPSTRTLGESCRATMGRDILYVGGSETGNYSTIQSKNIQLCLKIQITYLSLLLVQQCSTEEK